MLEQEDTKHRLDEIKAQFEQKITLLQEEKQKIEAKIEAVILSSDRKSNK